MTLNRQYIIHFCKTLQMVNALEIMIDLWLTALCIIKVNNIIICKDSYSSCNNKMCIRDRASGEQEVVLAEGKFGAWILGKETVDVALDGVKKLYLKVFTEDGRQGDLYEYESLKTIFWGNPVIETKNKDVYKRQVHILYSSK